MIRKRQKHLPPAPRRRDDKLPFIEHLYELRQRLFYVALSLVTFSVAGYFVQERLVSFLLKPSHGQHFIYTSPIGGLNFLFQICIYFGLVLTIPVLIYQLLRYLEPLIEAHNQRLVLRYSVISGLLAIAGACFGYFVGLPTALRFLSHQFTTSQIQPLLTIQEYMSFVTIYLLGSALMFQLPLIILFINRIKPMSPGKLLGFSRYMILISFIAAAIMTPTTDIFNQLIFAGPIMGMYYLATVLVYFRNRRRRPTKKLVQLMAHDVQVQAERLSRLRASRPMPLAPGAAVGQLTGSTRRIATPPPAARPQPLRPVWDVGPQRYGQQPYPSRPAGLSPAAS